MGQNIRRESRREKATSILWDLVNFDTTSSKSNLKLIRYIQDRFDVFGIPYELFPNPPDTNGVEKAHLFARIGPETPGGILLSAHTDCVPADGDWDNPPFSMTEKNGRLYGRGTADMKGFIACALSEVPVWAQSDLKKPVYILLSYDEEMGCQAVKEPLSILQSRGLSPDFCCVGEPTEMTIGYAHKTRADIFVTCRATGGHASKVNDEKITCANDIAVMLRENMRRNRRQIGERLGDLSSVGPASFAVTAWEFPSTRNVIPSKLVFHLDYRGGPGIPEKDVKQVLQTCADEVLDDYRQEKKGLAEIDFDIQFGNNGFRCTDKRTIETAKQLAQTETARPMDYVCEAARLMEYGFPKTVICGPGSINDAHQPNESVAVEQIERCEKMMQRITKHLTGPASTCIPK